jgi:hypothetical protein
VPGVNGGAKTLRTERVGIELPPVASMLMQSLRSVGYTAAAALADLMDNSIAAKATIVRVSVAMMPRPFVAVSDDGCGMDEATLLSAMRFGSRDPRDARDGADLGRFGLGLKTASLSQCRKVTVATVKDGHLSVARWDLDECDRRVLVVGAARSGRIAKRNVERSGAAGPRHIGYLGESRQA